MSRNRDGSPDERKPSQKVADWFDYMVDELTDFPSCFYALCFYIYVAIMSYATICEEFASMCF